MERLFLCFFASASSFFPFTGEVKYQTDEKRCKSGKGITQPETEIFHIKNKTKEARQADSQNDTVENGGNKVDSVVAAAVDQRIHAGASGAAKENQVDAISGATVTTNAINNGVNAAVSYFNVMYSSQVIKEEGGETNEE